MPALEAVAVRSDLAAVEAASGDLERALSTLRRAEKDASGNDVSGSIQAGLALALADLDLQFGRLQDADGEYRRAERLYMQAANDAGRAEAQQGRGMLLLMGDDYAGALRLFDLAARGQAGAGDRRTAALTRLLAGDAQRMAGDSAAARRTLLAALDSLRVLGDTVGEVAALVGLGALAEGRGAPLEAESLYRRGLGQLGDRAVPDLQWRLHAGLGRSLRARGDLPKAAEQLRAAVNAVEGVAAGVRLEERRAGFLADKWQVYAALALVEQARGRAAETFAVSERMRGRQMLALLARGRVVSRSRTSEREQDLRRRISELTEEIAGSAPVAGNHREPAAPRRSLAVAREALDAAQKAYAALLADMRESDPAYAAMVAAEPIDWRTAANRLGDDGVLLEYLVTDSASSALVVTRDTVVAFDLNADRRQLAGLVDFVRDAMDRPDTTVAPLWRAPLHRLYQLLIEPVEESGLLAGKRTIVIVPHGDLHFLPFGALLTDDAGNPFLIERYQLTYASVGERLAASAAPCAAPGPAGAGAGAAHGPAPSLARRAGKHSRAVRRSRHGARRQTRLGGGASRPRVRLRHSPPGHVRRAQQAQSALLVRRARRSRRRSQARSPRGLRPAIGRSVGGAERVSDRAGVGRSGRCSPR